MMFGSPPPLRPKDLNLPCRSANPSGGKRSEEPVPDVLRHQQQQISSGLLRYRSAPSSLLGEVCSPENETMFTRFLAPDLRQEGQLKTPNENGPQFLPTPPQEVNMQQSTIFHPQHQQMRNRSSMESSIPINMGSLRMETGQIKRSSSNLIRQSSSPADLFSHFTVDNGYATMRRTGGFRDKGQLSFSSRQSSIMSQISEMESEDMEGDSDKEEGTSADGDGNGMNFMLAGFPVNSWDDSSMFSNSYFSLKEGRVAEVKKMVGGFSSAEHQDGEVSSHASGLLHQLNLPKNSSATPTIEKFLHFHDAVPCKIRAKRGCATHPRSIAERVRRTRISERIRRLQELVPSMDKQTNTSDMLDLAVDYIKDLQKQVKAFSESQANCNCLASRQAQEDQS